MQRRASERPKGSFYHFDSLGVITSFTAGWDVWGKPKDNSFLPHCCFLLAYNTTEVQELHPTLLCNSRDSSKGMGSSPCSQERSSCLVKQWHQDKTGQRSQPGCTATFSTLSLYWMYSAYLRFHFYHHLPGSWWQISRGLSRQAHMARRSHVSATSNVQDCLAYIYLY